MKNFSCRAVVGLVVFCVATVGLARSERVFKIYGQDFTYDDVRKKDQSGFYDAELELFKKIENQAREEFFNTYWEKEAKRLKTTAAKVQESFASKVNVSKEELDEGMTKFEKFLTKIPADQRRDRVKEHLQQTKLTDELDKIFEAALAKGDFKLYRERPVEPVYDVKLVADDILRYGPRTSDTKPKKCKGASCPLVVVEYSEYQCGFCARVQPDIQRLLKEYEGNIVWTVRDFPLDFHKRAMPAAIAAKCASFQGAGKYWEMYGRLFSDQQKLGDDDFKSHAKSLGLNISKFEGCSFTANADNKNAKRIIANNFSMARELGVSATPTFFVNGKRISGAVPFSEFQRVMDEELAIKKTQGKSASLPKNGKKS